MTRTCQLQQLDYQAKRAFLQYGQVDPTSRLAADELELRWNEKPQARGQLNTDLNNEQVQTIGLNDNQCRRTRLVGTKAASDPA